MNFSITDLEKEVDAAVTKLNPQVVLGAMLAPRDNQYWLDMVHEINRSRPPTCAYARRHRHMRRIRKRIERLSEDTYCPHRLILSRLQLALGCIKNNLPMYDPCGQCFSCLVRTIGKPRTKTSHMIYNLIKSRDDASDFLEIFLNLIDGDE